MIVRARLVPKALAALAVAAAIVLAGQGSARADTTQATLYVKYAMNCTFTITDDFGNTVTQINPGTYQLMITSPVSFAAVDLSGVNDMTACKGSALFQLTGPGVSLTDTLTDGDGDFALYTVTFQKSSTYTAVDNNQPSVAHVVFTTAASGSPILPNSPYATNQGGNSETDQNPIASGAGKPKVTATPDPLRGQLTAVVSASGKVTLTKKGKPVSSLTSGRYTIVVSDRSKTSGFVIQAIKKVSTTISTGKFVGKKSKTVDLKPGQWFFYASFVGTKNFFIAVAPATT